MRIKKLRVVFTVIIAAYALAAVLPILGLKNKENNETKSNTPKSSSDVFLIQDADGTILKVDDTEFVKGGVAAEVPVTWEPEALKAQAVAVYTYYSRLREQNTSENTADFSCDTKNGVVYVPKEERKDRWGENFEEYEKTLDEVEQAVRGMTLEYNGELLCSTFFAVSSGSTDNACDVWGGEYGYLTPVASCGDIFAPGYLSTVKLSRENVQAMITEAFGNVDFDKDPSKWITELERTGSETVKSGNICGVSATGTQIRNAFGLRSANFTVKYKENMFTFTVKGWGHNVGMSQTGAQYMAENGANFEDILAWYYSGSTLVK